ncbi:hypothetical protein [Streptomyces sp. NPDC058398]|uniref:hypothetical protein n=1 Tax=Streptomyces sp. NPDC058398 TaxID=3346479 RepID=UPI003648A40A
MTMSTATPPLLAPLPADIADVVSRYVSAAVRYDELSARPAPSLSPSEAAELRAAQPVIGEMFEALSAPGRRGLVVAAEVAVRYRAAAARYRRLAANGDYDDCLPVQDEMTMCRCQLAKAGLLYLIERATVGAS